MSERVSNRRLYVIIVVVLLALMILGVALHRQGKASAAAEAKADRLIALLVSKGFAAPQRDVVVRMFGTDGGAICADPQAAMERSALALRLGVGGGVVSRPIILGTRMLVAEAAVLAVYCPQKLPEFKAWVDSLKLSDWWKPQSQE